MILEVEHIRVRYRTGALGVTDVSLTVDAGEVVALFGANGAGKTTTARAISGFLGTEGVRVSGSVRLFGRDTTNMQPHRKCAMGLAFVPERKKIFPSMTVADNLEVLAKRPPRSERAAIYERIFDTFPVLRDRQNDVAGLLSGGQQQMLAIARSLMAQSKLLIIDEVTLGLHHSVHGPLFEVIAGIAKTGVGVLVIDEDSGRALDVASRWYSLSAGRVHESGDRSDWARSSDLAREAVDAK